MLHDMESFRWILIITGVFLLILIYCFYWLERSFPQWFGKQIEEEKTDECAISEDEVIYINIKSREDMISGPDLFRVMEKYNLRHGDMDIFHRLAEGSEQPLFSVVNMVEPGDFDLKKLMSFETPGITMFLQLPRTFDALHALDEMWYAAQSIAKELDAVLLDRNHQPLSSQKQQNMRDEVLEYMRQIALCEKISEHRQGNSE